MYQLVNKNLSNVSKLIFKLNSPSYRHCSTPIYFSITRSNRHFDLFNQSINQLSVRNLSITPMALLKEKPKYDENKKEEILIGEIKEESRTDSVKKFFKDYGKLGFFVYISVSLTTIGILFTLINLNVDLEGLISYFHLTNRLADLLSTYGSGSKFILAYCISKLLLPLRLSLSLVVCVLLKKVGVKF